jgi:hypothetical protein
VNLSRHQFLGRLVTLLQHGREHLGNFQRPRGRRRPARGQHVLDVIVKSSRQEKLERARRWRRGLQWGGLAAVAVVVVTTSHQAVARYFWQNPDLRLAHGAQISTNGTLTYDDILRHAGLSEKTHVYDVDLRTVRERLETLPNVRHASVARELPGRLVIEVEERLPAMWLSCDLPKLRTLTADTSIGACLIDEEGYLFHCTELRSELLRLPVLHLRKLAHTQAGVHLTNAPVQTGLDLLRRLRTTFGPRGLDVTEIDAPNDWSLVAKLTDDLTVTFGYDAIGEQIDRLVRVIDIAAASGRQLRTVNLLPRKNVPVTFIDEEVGAEKRPTPTGASTPVSSRQAAHAPPVSPIQSTPEADSLEAILGGGR